MIKGRMLLAALCVLGLGLGACGGGDEGAAEGGAAEGGAGVADSMPSETPPLAPSQEVDTAGMGTNPPTGGGQVVGTTGAPGPTDTAQGTATAP